MDLVLFGVAGVSLTVALFVMLAHMAGMAESKTLAAQLKAEQRRAEKALAEVHDLRNRIQTASMKLTAMIKTLHD